MEADLVRANQTGLTGDNLVSVDGAEEDGVDNRVEAPTWVPDGGSDKAADEQSEGESAATPDTEGTESVITPSDRTDSPASAEPAEPAATEDPWSRTNGSSQADADDPWARVSSTPQPAPGRIRSALSW